MEPLGSAPVLIATRAVKKYLDVQSAEDNRPVFQTKNIGSIGSIVLELRVHQSAGCLRYSVRTTANKTSETKPLRFKPKRPSTNIVRTLSFYIGNS